MRLMKKFLFISILLLFVSCESDTYYELQNHDTALYLKWNKAYPDDTMDKSLIGLKWGLSYVGAKLPASLNGISTSNNVISINITKLGFSESAIEKLSKLNLKIKESQEYRTTNAIDLGRYITLLLGASEHYYEIVGVPNRLDAILNQYTLSPEKGYVNNSNVSFEHRIIQFSEQNGFNQVFISKEIDPNSGQIHEYETIELLPNGQLRFGIFDANGNRKNNADASYGKAGKPGKCMWCHESSINQMYTSQNDFTGYLSASAFQNKLINYKESNRILKLTLVDGVDFSQTQQHTLTELLYISFMEPSAERLSLEWGIPLTQVQSLLSNLPTHIYAEFPFLGNLYNRKDIESLAPFQGLSVSSSVREQSIIEVNHLN